MMKTPSRICPICEWKSAQILDTQKFVLPQGHLLSEEYDVVCCARCGFVYADTATTQEEYNDFYAQFSKYEDNKTSTGGAETPWDAKRLEDMAQHLTRFISDRNNRVLDIGCANGGLLRYLKQLGFNNLYGLDPSPMCIANTQFWGIEAHMGSLFDPPKSMGQFDCLILSHVLEHVRDLKLAVESIYALTKTGGCVYIEVPNASLYADYVFSPFQEFNTEHINHFSNLCIANLMGLGGFKQKEAGQKLFESPQNMPYPAIYSFSVKAEKATSDFTLERDSLLEENIKAYIYKSRKVMDGIEKKLLSILAKSPEVIVWGTGQLAMKLLKKTALARAKIVAFVDGNSINQGKVLRNNPILAPEQIRGMKHPIIVTSILHYQAIANNINQLGLQNEVILLGEEQ